MLDLRNCDCMDLMREFPDKYFDLAIVDPPYGIGANKMTLGNGKNKIFRGASDWDASPPDDFYFSELFRVSRNQIIWGANYFPTMLFGTMGWIFWDKGTGLNDFSDGEIAFSSFQKALKKIFISWVGANAKDCGDRIHPTQKPVALYRWILSNYAKEGDKILDTHLGSGSIAIACHEKGFDLTGSELDPDYFKAMQKRLADAMLQQAMPI